MHYKITTRTQGAGADPFAWVIDDFVVDGSTVDEAIDKGRAAAIAKYPDAHTHLVYGAVPAQDEPTSETPRAPKARSPRTRVAKRKTSKPKSMKARTK